VINNGDAQGQQFDIRDEKNDIAFLGELDFGLLYHISCRTRFRIGYRAIGVSGVALAADQFQDQFADQRSLFDANSNGSLLLGGGYFGTEFCF